MDCFYICKDATLPTLRLELTYDGKYDFMKSLHFYNAIQNADVTLSMWNEHDELTISNAPCNIVLVDENTCDERYIIEYVWKERDTKKDGHYKAKIKIVFNGDLVEDGETYENGAYIGPLYEDIDVYVKP